jgi:hypothetical protein
LRPAAVVFNSADFAAATESRYDQDELVFVFKVGTLPHRSSFGLGDTARYHGPPLSSKIAWAGIIFRPKSGAALTLDEGG